jgi:hypothetical protein
VSKKSYWMPVLADTPHRQTAILSWFRPLCDGYTVESAEILCDIETDREKKIRAVVRDQKGNRKLATRTLGGRQSTIKLQSIVGAP